MASPQVDNGHTRISNEILEKLYSTNINGTQLRIVLFVIRKTYGWGKKRDKIALSQFVSAIGKDNSLICKNINTLVSMKIIIKIQDDNGSEYEFNKDYDEWELVSKMTHVKNDNDPVSKMTIDPVSKMTHTKENNTKETIQKKSNASVVFPKTLKSFRDQRRIEAGKPPMAPRPMTSAQKRAHTELVKIQPLIDRYKELASEKGLSYLEFPEETNQKLRRQFLNVIAKYGGEWNDFFEWIFTGKHRWAKQAQYNPESCLVGFMFDAYKNKDVENEINTNGFIS